MNEWPIIRLTQARQVAELMAIERERMPEDGVGVPEFYRQARARSATDALDVIGHALPRFEATCWAAEVLDRESRKRDLPPSDRQALDSALRWTGEPDDANRRRAYAAAEGAADSSPERLLAYAVFLSGGSLSQPDLPAVLPEPSTCCRLAVAAVKVAGYRNDDPEPVFEEALALAEGVAQRGVAALRPA